MGGTDDTRLLQLVHQSSGTVVADSELTLYQTRRPTLVDDDQAGGILKHRVEVLHIHIGSLTHLVVRHIRLRQLKGREVALLLCDKLVDALHLRSIHEGTLYTDRLAAVEIQHVASSYQLLGTRSV